MGDPYRLAAATLRTRVGRSRRGRSETHRIPAPRKVLVAFLTATVMVGPFTSWGRAAPGDVPFCTIPGQITPHPEFWYSVKVPAFPSGPQLISDYAVEPLVSERLYVTNGQVVMRSSDSGCHWSQSYSVAELGPAAAGGAKILEIEVSAPGTVYLPIQQSSPTPQPHVVVTKDAGKTWTTADGPLLNATVGTIQDLDASLGNGSAAVMLVDVQYMEPGPVTIDGQQVLFATSTAGQTWEPRHRIDNGLNISAPNIGGSINPRDPLQFVSMNPVRPNDVWVYGEGGVFFSDGANLEQVRSLDKVSFLDVTLDGSAVVAYDQYAPVSYVSLDGQEFAPFQTGFTADSLDAVFGVPVPQAAVSAFGRVYLQATLPGQPPLIFDVSPEDGRPISDVQVAFSESADQPSIFGRTSNTIEVTYQPEGEKVDTDNFQATIELPPLSANGNVLAPVSTRIKLRPGASRTIPYRLDLPAANTPLDVYFMIDISGSMGGTINGIRAAMQDIVDKLAEKKLDVRFGVGAFRAFNDPPAYARVRDIGLNDQALANALNSLRANGGGAETQLAALKESVTGAGESGIDPGLNMHFRPGSLRVAIETTDEPISQGGGHPPPGEVVEALKKHDVKMVGLAIQEPPLLGEPDYDDPGEPASTLQDVAEGSHAVAPAGGVDCDGDGDVEIAAEGPLVCLISPDRADDASLMADAIVGVLEAVEDIQDLAVSVTARDGVELTAPVVDTIEPSVFSGVDLKEPSAHAFDLTVRCPHVGRKTTYPLRVAVSRPTGALADAFLTLVCDPPVKEAPVPLLPVFTPIAAVLPPLPRPPDPIPEPNPNPQPNPQQNPQAGFAAQEQQQPQVALAQQEGPALPVEEETVTDEYFATRHQESGVPPLAFIFAVAGITSVYAYAVATRARTRTAHAGNRRRRRH